MGELIVTIKVTTYDAQILEGKHAKVVMIPFSCEAEGDYFTGKSLANGVDTQIAKADGFSLSARYMLEGCEHLRRTEVKVDDQTFSDPFIGKSDGTDINTISLDELVKQYL